MAIHWGGWSGGTYTGLRVGMQVTVSPASPSHSDSTVKVTVAYYWGSSGSISDDITYHKGGNGSGTIGIHASAGNGTSTHYIDTDTHTYSLSYSNSGTKTFTASISGAHNGASPTATYNVNLPERPSAAPDKPSTPNLGVGDQSGNQRTSAVHLVWSYPDGNGDGPTAMEVGLYGDSGFSNLVEAHYDSASPSSWVGLHKYTTYYARCRAHNERGDGPWSNVTSARTDGTVPGKIRSLKITNITSSGVHFTYSPPSDTGGPSLSGYTWSVCTDSAGNNIVVTDQTTSRDISSGNGVLSPSHTYYIRVRARNSVGSGDVVVKSFKTDPASGPGNSPPSAPTGLNAGSITKDSTVLTWNAPASNGGDAIDSYTVQISTNTDYSDAHIVFEDDTPDATRSMTVTGLPPSTALLVRVQANNGAGSGPYSNGAFITLSGIRRWNGTAWVDCTIVRRWTGTAWVDADVYRATATGTGGWS